MGLAEAKGRDVGWALEAMPLPRKFFIFSNENDAFLCILKRFYTKRK